MAVGTRPPVGVGADVAQNFRSSRPWRRTLSLEAPSSLGLPETAEGRKGQVAPGGCAGRESPRWGRPQGPAPAPLHPPPGPATAQTHHSLRVPLSEEPFLLLKIGARREFSFQKMRFWTPSQHRAFFLSRSPEPPPRVRLPGSFDPVRPESRPRKCCARRHAWPPAAWNPRPPAGARAPPQPGPPAGADRDGSLLPARCPEMTD